MSTDGPDVALRSPATDTRESSTYVLITVSTYSIRLGQGLDLP